MRRLTLAAIALAALAFAAPAAGTDTGPLIPYTPGSYLTSTPGAIDATLTAQMRTFIAANNKGLSYPKLNGLGSNKWGMVYREGQAADPIWKLTGTVPTKVAFLATTGFHAPADLCSSITGTSDSPLIVMDVASGFTVAAQKASCTATPNVLHVGAAGAFYHTSNGLDGKRPESTDKRNLASRGRIPDSMVIRKDRLDWAVANGTDLGYVLEIFWPETSSAAGFRFPMTGAEGSKTGWGAEGQRISIDPTVDLSTRNCTPYAYTIALTLQRHGAYIGDNAGGAAAFKMEQDSAGHPVWRGAVKQSELAGCVSWSDFVANVSPK